MWEHKLFVAMARSRLWPGLSVIAMKLEERSASASPSVDTPPAAPSRHHQSGKNKTLQMVTLQVKIELFFCAGKFRRKG